MTGKPSSRPSVSSRPTLRCAIYTRKSSEEGLGQEFNSLDAQHEACAAYVASQKHEGWTLAPGRYDDGGLSGGTLERPGLQRLLADIDAGRVQIVVVYKIDRLTRSLADFAKLVERLEARGCSFVSVTQAFNTSSSMGRLTLNVLLSFAQFEREVTAERIRDKIAASKRKGMWMGGLPPLGYDPPAGAGPEASAPRQLVVNPAEAEVVRTLFGLYDQMGCLRDVELEAHQLGLRSKPRTFASGRASGGQPLSRGQIHHLLTNPVYRGLIRHKALLHPGLHEPLVDEALWTRVQAKLQTGSARPRTRQREPGAEVLRASNRSEPAPRDHLPSSAPLIGRLRDETGDRLTPTHARKDGRRLRYYTSSRLLQGRRGEPRPGAAQLGAAQPEVPPGAARSAAAPGRAGPALVGPGAHRGWRLPAPALERTVAALIADHLEAAAGRHVHLAQPEAGGANAVAQAASALVASLRDETRREGPLRRLVAAGQVRVDRISLELDPAALSDALAVPPGALAPSLLVIETPLQMPRRGLELRLVAGPRAPAPDPTLIAALARATRWLAALRTGEAILALATREGRSESFVRSRLELAFLSPRLQAAILAGTQPSNLTLERLVRTPIPLDWAKQEQVFGVAG